MKSKLPAAPLSETALTLWPEFILSVLAHLEEDQWGLFAQHNAFGVGRRGRGRVLDVGWLVVCALGANWTYAGRVGAAPRMSVSPQGSLELLGSSSQSTRRLAEYVIYCLP